MIDTPTNTYRDVPLVSRYTRDRLATASLLVSHAIAIAEAKTRSELKSAVSALHLLPVSEYLPDALYAVEDVCTRWDVAADTEIRL